MYFSLHCPLSFLVGSLPLCFFFPFPRGLGRFFPLSSSTIQHSVARGGMEGGASGRVGRCGRGGEGALWAVRALRAVWGGVGGGGEVGGGGLSTGGREGKVKKHTRHS